MPTLDWEDIQEISVDQARQAILDQLAVAGFKATSFQRFSVPLALIEIGALMWNSASKIAVAVKSAVFVPTSTGEALTRLSESHYDNERESATNATRLVTLACSATEGPHTLNVGDVVISDANDITFRNVEGNSVTYPVVLASGGTQQLLFEAEVAGASGNVPDDTVTTLVTTYAGVTVSTEELDTEAVDEESDDRLRTRDISKWALLSQYELIDDAVVALALGASPSITTVRVHSDNPRGPGTFDVYISGDVQSSSEDDVEAAQAAIAPLVFGQEDTVQVYAAEELELDLIGTVYYAPTIGAAAARAAVEAALDAYLLTIPLGGFDYSPGPSDEVPKNDIEAVIRSAQASGVPVVRTLVLNDLDGLDTDGNLSVGNFRKVVRGNWNTLTFVPTTR